MEGAALSLRLVVFDSAEPILRIHPSNGRNWPFGTIPEIECRHGERRIQALLVADQQVPSSTMWMSRRVADSLRIAPESWTQPMMISSTRVQFGPLIGILANPVWDKNKRTVKSSQQLPALVKLLEAGKKQDAACFLFSLSGVNLQQGHVVGFFLHDGHWYRRTLPMPDVIYDQLVSRKIERDPANQDKREALTRRYGRRFFNDGFFDKWQVHEWLTDAQDVRMHVPETVRHTTIERAATFVNRHHVTFLKPLHGSLGVGIARFIRLKDGSVTYEIKQNTSSVIRGKASSPKEALDSFRTRLKRRPYIWQEGLTLATYQGRPLDIRILMQRDHTGDWKRTKMFARVAKSGDFTSNLTGGGDAMTVDEALAESLPKAEQRNRAKEQIRRLSKQIALAIEEGSGRQFGELGIDLGIDTNGKVWIIEVNSKPRKSATTDKGRQDLVDLSFNRPMGYAIHLATTTNP